MTTDAAPRTVLFVNHEVEFGGSERSLMELLAGLDRERWRPVLACPAEGPLPSAAQKIGVVVRPLPLRFSGRLDKLLGLREASRCLAAVAADENAAIVHANSLLAGYVALLAAFRSRRPGTGFIQVRRPPRLTGEVPAEVTTSLASAADGVPGRSAPLVWHLRDMSYPTLGQLALSRADAVIANSRATADALPESLRESGRVHAIHNGVAPAFFDATSARSRGEAGLREELGLAPDTPLAGMVGRISPWKGHRTFLDAAAEARRAVPSAHFVIVGDVLFDGSRRAHGDLPAELKQHAAAIGLGARAHFLGQRDDVPALIADLDVVVHPSTEPEPFGRSAAEAMAAGTPIIASDVGGLPEVVTDDVTGLLVPPGDAAALGTAIARVLGDAALASRLASAARADARVRFTRARHVADVERLYDALLRE